MLTVGYSTVDNLTKQTQCEWRGMDLRKGATISRMNTRGICLECAGGEQHAPGYAVARKTEQDVVLRIDENFKGEGL